MNYPTLRGGDFPLRHFNPCINIFGEDKIPLCISIEKHGAAP